MTVRRWRETVVILFTLAQATVVAIIATELLRRGGPALGRVTAWLAGLLLLFMIERWLWIDVGASARGARLRRDPLVTAWRLTAIELRHKASLLDSLRRPLDSVLADKAADVYARCADELEERGPHAV